MNLNLLLNEYLTKESEKRVTRERSGKWSPSMFGRCFRAQYWNRKNIPQSNPVDAFTQRRFIAGDCVHDFIQKILPEHQSEVKVETEDVFGYADIVTDKKVIDIKSVMPFAYKYIDKEDFNVVEQKYHNVMQVMSYAYLLNKEEGQLSFVDMGTLDIREFNFKTLLWRERVEKELNTLRDYWVNNQTPPAEPRAFMKDGKSKECEYCSFRETCKLTEANNVK